MSEINDFYITLLSNDSLEKYPQNSLSQFTNYLDPWLQLAPQEWKVGISEIYYNAFTPAYTSFDALPAFSARPQPTTAENIFHAILPLPIQAVMGSSERANKEEETLKRLEYEQQKQELERRKQTTMDLFFIYTNITKSRSVGSQCAKLLKILPATCQTPQVARFGHIEYVPIHDEYIRSISIKIADQEGRKIRFDPSVLPTMLTLHFKKNGI